MRALSGLVSFPKRRECFERCTQAEDVIRPHRLGAALGNEDRARPTTVIGLGEGVAGARLRAPDYTHSMRLARQAPAIAYSRERAR